MPKTNRYATLIKKAEELSVLCEAEIAVITISRDGKLRDYSTTTVEHTLSRYHKYKVAKDLKNQRHNRPETFDHQPKSCDDKHVLDQVKGRHAELSLEKSRRMGKNLDGLSREELCKLEEEQIRALLSVKNKKEELLRRRMNNSVLREQQLMEQNLSLLNRAALDLNRMP